MLRIATGGRLTNSTRDLELIVNSSSVCSWSTAPPHWQVMISLSGPWEFALSRAFCLSYCWGCKHEIPWREMIVDVKLGKSMRKLSQWSKTLGPKFVFQCRNTVGFSFVLFFTTFFNTFFLTSYVNYPFQISRALKRIFLLVTTRSETGQTKC